MITIDTTGDNLWNRSPENCDEITTENVKYTPRCQEFCEAFGFYPTYLKNYEMAKSSCFADDIKPKLRQNMCEIGMHLHAWNSPPAHKLQTRTDGKIGNPYLIEYPTEIMELKDEFMTNLLSDVFETQVTSHRAGRRAMNQDYSQILNQGGYQADCSVTPLMDWSNHPGQTADSRGTNYTNYPQTPLVVQGTSIVELPVTVIRDHRKIPDYSGSSSRRMKLFRRAMQGYGHLWFRPDGNNLEDMLYVADRIRKSSQDPYLMFVLHSSELMPRGSPTFSTEEKLEKLYSDLRVLFSYLSSSYEGFTVKDYVQKMKLK